MTGFPYSVEAAGELLADAGTKATVLQTILLCAYGGQALFGHPGDELQPRRDPVDPVLLFNQAEQDFSVTIPPECENKINALVLATSSNAFYEDPAAFMAVCNALESGELGDLVSGFVEEVTVPEMLWACYEVLLNRGYSDDPFSPQVSAIIDEVVKTEVEDGQEGELAYYERYLLDEREELIQQLVKLGVSQDAITHLRSISPSGTLNEVAEAASA